MRFFLTAFRLDARRSIFTPAFALLLGCMLAVTGGAGFLLSGSTGAFSARVAIVCGEPSDSARILSYLPEASAVDFIVTDDEAEARRFVSTGRLDCAYILPPDLTERLLSDKIDGAVRLLRSPKTVLEPVVSKWVFSAVVAAHAHMIAADELAHVYGVSAESLLPDITERYVDYYENYHFVTAETVWRGGAAREALTPFSGARSLHGLIAITLLAAALTSCPLLQDAKMRIRGLSGLKNRFLFYLAAYTMMCLRFFLLGAAGALYAALLTDGQVAARLPVLFALCVLLSGGSLLLAALTKPGTSLFVPGVFVVLCCLLLGGVLVDPAELGGVFAGVSSFLFTTRYINAALYNTSLLPLVVPGALSCLTALCILLAKR